MLEIILSWEQARLSMALVFMILDFLTLIQCLEKYQYSKTASSVEEVGPHGHCSGECVNQLLETRLKTYSWYRVMEWFQIFRIDMY